MSTATIFGTAGTMWKNDPATSSQLSYLDSLLASRDPKNLTHAMIATQRAGEMTKGQASAAIEALVKMPKMPKVDGFKSGFKTMSAAAEEASKAMTVVVEAIVQKTVEFGIYDLHPDLPAPTSIPSGRWIIVYPAKHGGMRVKRLYKSYSTKSGFSWKQSSTAHFTGIKQGHYTKVSVEDIAKLGQTVGFCFYCGSFLSDPESKSKGYGPICAKHYGLPWGK